MEQGSGKEAKLNEELEDLLADMQRLTAVFDGLTRPGCLTPPGRPLSADQVAHTQHHEILTLLYYSGMRSASTLVVLPNLVVTYRPASPPLRERTLLCSLIIQWTLVTLLFAFSEHCLTGLDFHKSCLVSFIPPGSLLHQELDRHLLSLHQKASLLEKVAEQGAVRASSTPQLFAGL